MLALPVGLGPAFHTETRLGLQGFGLVLFFTLLRSRPFQFIQEYVETSADNTNELNTGRSRDIENGQSVFTLRRAILEITLESDLITIMCSSILA